MAPKYVSEKMSSSIIRHAFLRAVLRKHHYNRYLTKTCSAKKPVNTLYNNIVGGGAVTSLPTVLTLFPGVRSHRQRFRKDRA